MIPGYCVALNSIVSKRGLKLISVSWSSISMQSQGRKQGQVQRGETSLTVAANKTLAHRFLESSSNV